MKNTEIKIYKAKDGWRWRMIRSNRIVADSGESYKRKSSLRKSLNNLLVSIGLECYTID